MNAEDIILLIMAILLLGWVIYVAIRFNKNLMKEYEKSGLIARVKCEKCETERDVQAQEYARPGMIKQVSAAKTRVKGVALENSPNYRYYAMKCHCPECNKKVYAQVLNINELNAQSRSFTMREGSKCLLLMFIGGCLIMLVMSVPLKIARHQREKQVEQMREEYYDQLRNKYYAD